jgi:protein TonB
MFEQTLLTHPPSGQKTRALAVSFMAQMSLLGVLLVAPLLYTQVLPLVVDTSPIYVPIFHPEPPVPPAPVTTSSVSTSPSRSLSIPRQYVPRAVPNNSPISATGPDITPVEIGGGPTIAVIGTETGRDRLSGSEGLVSRLPEAVAAAPVVITATPPTPAPQKPISVSSGVQASKLVSKVMPAYPTPAKLARVQGTVRLSARIGKDGHVAELRTLEGHPLLRRAAEDAVRQWVYSPTYLSGVAVEVETSIDVHFSLQ